MEVMHPKFFEVFKKHDGYKAGHVKLKKPQQLQEILDIARELLETLSSGTVESEMIEEKNVDWFPKNRSISLQQMLSEGDDVHKSREFLSTSANEKLSQC